MYNKKLLATVLLLGVITTIVPAACSSGTSSAKFEIASVKIKPNEIYVGETAYISAEVTNIGGAAGTYSATMSVDGKRTNTKDISLNPGFSQTVTFSLLKDQAGAYDIGIGGKSAELTVKSKLVAKQVDLDYDGGVAKDYLSLVKPCTGYSVYFVSPSKPFIINKVRVFGLVYGSPGFHIEESDLQIWDENQKVLYTTSFPGDQFPLRTRLGANIDSTGAWADIEIPDVAVEGNFYVHIYTGIPTGQGFRMGAGDTVNTHSDVTIRGDNGVDTFAPDWPYMPVYWYGDRNRVNWLIRITGNAMVAPD